MNVAGAKVHVSNAAVNLMPDQAREVPEGGKLVVQGTGSGTRVALPNLPPRRKGRHLLLRRMIGPQAATSLLFELADDGPCPTRRLLAGRLPGLRTIRIARGSAMTLELVPALHGGIQASTFVTCSFNWGEKERW